MKEYDLKADHKAIKKQIKVWEGNIYIIVGWILDTKELDEPLDLKRISDTLQDMSEEMMAINI